MSAAARAWRVLCRIGRALVLLPPADVARDPLRDLAVRDALTRYHDTADAFRGLSERIGAQGGSRHDRP